MTDEAAYRGEDIITLPCPDFRTRQACMQSMLAGDIWEEVVPGMADITVRFDPDRLDAEEALEKCTGIFRAHSRNEAASEQATAVNNPPVIRMTADFSPEAAPDLKLVVKALKIDPATMPEWLCGRRYQVGMMGFQPGFPYLSDMDGDGLPSIPRLATPRQRVLAGSIGFLGQRACIYAQDGPGGWPIVGRVVEQLFDADSDQPFLLSPGQIVEFGNACN